MRLGFCTIFIVTLLAAAGETLAAGHAVSSSPGAVIARGAPFAAGAREQAIRDELVCWSGCQSICTDGLHRCVADAIGQGSCLAATGRCDRVCQSDCRQRGGPLIEPIPR